MPELNSDAGRQSDADRSQTEWTIHHPDIEICRHEKSTEGFAVASHLDPRDPVRWTVVTGKCILLGPDRSLIRPVIDEERRPAVTGPPIRSPPPSATKLLVPFLPFDQPFPRR